MAAGLHEGSPSSLRVIQTSQHRRNPDSGFLQRLIQDGITFDITGYHYYTQDGHVRAAANGENALQVLHRRFGKPIWITEFDKAGHNGSGPNSDPDAQARVLMIAMQEIAADSRKYNVVAAYIYELLDEPDLLATKPTQAEFGILKANGAPTSASTAVRAFLESYY
jgi:Glycosyl hydrolase catalytic core